MSAAALGGRRVHDRNGVAHFVAAGDADAGLLVRDLLEHLPCGPAGRPPVRRPLDPPACGPAASVPAEARSVYDVREVARALLDGGRLLEYAPRWARNVVCGFGRLEGRSVGIVANQPKIPRRRAGRRGRVQGRPLRAHLQRVRTAARGAGRHAGLHARSRAGGGRRDPPRREALARVRRGDGAEGHGRAAQGVRRRVYRHERARPRGRLRVRLAAGPARRDGRQAGRDHRQPARHRGGGGPARGPRPVRRRLCRGAPLGGRRRRGGLHRRGDPARRHPPAPVRRPDHLDALPAAGGAPGNIPL